jgi:hypothetical protein
VDVFLLDQANLDAWKTGQPFGAWSVTKASGSGSLDLSLLDGEAWTLVFSNEPTPDVRRTLDVDVRVERTE